MPDFPPIPPLVPSTPAQCSPDIRVMQSCGTYCTAEGHGLQSRQTTQRASPHWLLQEMLRISPQTSFKVKEGSLVAVHIILRPKHVNVSQITHVYV